MSENFWNNLTFYLFVGGLSGDVIIAIIAAILVHQKNLKESTKHTFQLWLEWLAAISAILVLGAILSEHHASKLREQNFENQITSVRESVPRSLTLIDQRGISSMIGGDENKPPIIIFLDENVTDAEPLGHQLFDIFTNAGFKVTMMNGLNYSSLHGIIVGEFGTVSKSVFNIYGGLKWAHLDTSTNGGNASFPNKIFIDVERNPI